MRRAAPAPGSSGAGHLGGPFGPFASRYYPAAPTPITLRLYSVMHSCVST
jgi:hypothetical protein